jgi:hypothetical protein
VIVPSLSSPPWPLIQVLHPDRIRVTSISPIHRQSPDLLFPPLSRRSLSRYLPNKAPMCLDQPLVSSTMRAASTLHAEAHAHQFFTKPGLCQFSRSVSVALHASL